MTDELNEEHAEFRKVVREFAEAEIAPHAETWDQNHELPTDLIHAMGDLGLFGLTVPEEYGGAGADLTSVCIAIEEIGRVDQSIGLTLEAAVGLGVGPIVRYGTDEQRRRWLPDLASGRALAAFALTEPDSGSDAAALRTRAREDGEHWVLDGSKQFITNSGTPLTSVITVAASTGEGEISTILVPAGTPGLTVEPAYRKLGWHASDTHPLTLAGCRVPRENLLGRRGGGLRQFLATLDEGRIAISALATGCIRACLEQATAYAKQRTAFGSAIGSNQGVSFQLADLAVAAEAAALLTYSAAAAVDAGRPPSEITAKAAKAKLYSTEAAVGATRTALQIFGGNGFMEEYPIARFYRDAKILEIGEGTSEVQRLVIARSLGLG